MHPIHITVAVTGILCFFANADNSASASEYKTPPPEIIIGCFEFFIFSAAVFICFGSG